jgi:serine/threonine-protein kinase
LERVRTRAPYEVAVQEGLGFAFFVVAILLARYNWMHGRGDVRGAAIVFLYLLSAILLSIVLGAHRISVIDQLSMALSVSAPAAIFYLALEPWVRRIWPQALITWSRVLAGRWRDPVVARDVAIGVLAAVCINCLRHALYLWASPVGASATANVYVGGLARFSLDQLMGTRFVASAALYCFGGGFSLALNMFFLFFLARAVCRKPWLGALVYIAVTSLILLPFLTAGDWIELTVQTTVNLVTVLVMLRFGLLALAVWASVGWFIEHSLLTHEFGAWYGGSSLVVVAVIAALALWAFHTSSAGTVRSVAEPVKA